MYSGRQTVHYVDSTGQQPRKHTIGPPLVVVVVLSCTVLYRVQEMGGSLTAVRVARGCLPDRLRVSRDSFLCRTQEVPACGLCFPVQGGAIRSHPA